MLVSTWENTSSTMLRAFCLIAICCFASGCNSFFANGARENELIGQRMQQQQVFVSDQRPNLLDPITMEAAGDSNVFIGGSLGLTAVVTKQDRTGRIIWEYTKEKTEPLMPHFYPAYHGVVSMGDGTVFACGWYPSPAGSTASGALLTHLDASGHRLAEELVPAPSYNEITVEPVNFQACARWGDDVLLKGYVSSRLVLNENSNEIDAHALHWFVLMDSRGKIKWSRFVNPTPGVTPIFGPRENKLLVAGNSLFFSNTVNGSTEVICIGHDGEVKGRKIFPVEMRLVRPVKSESTVQLLGIDWNTWTHTLITLNEKLETLQEIRATKQQAFRANIIYRLPDHSFALFGSMKGSQGQTFVTGIAHVDAELKSFQFYRPVAFNKSYEDIGQVTAASPLGVNNQFLTAFATLAVKPGSNNLIKQGRAQNLTRGVMYESVTLK